MSFRLKPHASVAKGLQRLTPLKAPRQEHVKSVFELPERVLDELAEFFLNAVAFEGKELAILGWGGPDEAKAAVKTASVAFDREIDGGG